MKRPKGPVGVCLVPFTRPRAHTYRLAQPRWSGFTLIELLVVIAIVGEGEPTGLTPTTRETGRHAPQGQAVHSGFGLKRSDARRYSRPVRRTILCLCLLSNVAFAAETARAAGLSTTTPVTQDRDHAIYDWQKRHAEVLARNQEFKPDVVIFGDSIIHYWGGEPAAPMAWAPQAWSNCFAGLKVTNLGFGWDRTENVLWRIEHGELDGIKPKVIVIKIGTNNTAVDDSPADIASGIEAVCAAAHQIQPGAKLLLLGILPRRDEKLPRPSITEKVNALLASRFSGVSWLTYRDFDAAFRSPDGTPDARLFSDGVHVNAAGYEILGRKIREQLLVLMK
jgi:lysophospholipase L1-like esterase